MPPGARDEGTPIADAKVSRRAARRFGEMRPE